MAEASLIVCKQRAWQQCACRCGRARAHGDWKWISIEVCRACMREDELERSGRDRELFEGGDRHLAPARTACFGGEDVSLLSRTCLPFRPSFAGALCIRSVAGAGHGSVGRSASLLAGAKRAGELDECLLVLLLLDAQEMLAGQRVLVQLTEGERALGLGLVRTGGKQSDGDRQAATRASASEQQKRRKCAPIAHAYSRVRAHASRCRKGVQQEAAGRHPPP